jgi:hypothetical protein
MRSNGWPFCSAAGKWAMSAFDAVANFCRRQGLRMTTGQPAKADVGRSGIKVAQLSWGQVVKPVFIESRSLFPMVRTG